MRKSNFITRILSGWKIILFFLVAASTLAVKYNYFTAKTFCTTAEIKSDETQTGNYQAVIGAVNNQKEFVEYFQVESLYKTELYKNSPVVVSYNLKNEKFYKQPFEFEYSGNNTFTLTYSHNGMERTRNGEFGKEIHEADLNFTINKNSELIPARSEALLNKKLQFIIYSEKALADNLLTESVNINTQNGTTAITVTNTAPEKAMTLANEIAESFTKQNSSITNLDLINEQLSKVASELDNAQAIVAKYKSENSITDFPMQADAQLSHLENLELQKMNLQMQSLALDNLSDYMRQNRTSGNAAPEYGTITDPVFAEYITKLNEKISANTTQYDNQNSTLNSEINILKNTIAEGIRNTRKKTALQTVEINKQIAIAKTGFAVLPEKESQLQTLNRNLYLAEKLYTYLVDKRTEAMFARSVPVTLSNIIQPAALPLEPLNTESNIVWAIALLIGLLTGCICGLIKNKFEQQNILGRKAIDKTSTIPFFTGIENNNSNDNVEQFRNICTKILMNGGENQKQVITVTSVNRGEGKTFFVSQLAKSLVACDLKVLMIEMNSSGNDFENMFDIQHRITLSAAIQNKINLQEAVCITSIPNLDILVGGEFTGGINSLLVNHKIENILNELKQHYDFIIIDSPDISSSVNAIPLMKFSSTNLFMVSSGANVQESFENIENIRNDYKIENLFYVLNTASGQVLKQTKSTPVKKYQTTSEATPFLKKVAMWFY